MVCREGLRPRRVGLAAWAALGVFFAAPAGHAYHLEDGLRGGTRGNAVGGSFAADGWHVTDRRDRVWYAIPRLVSGSVEFTLANVTMASLGSTADTELFAMYEAGYGIAEPIRYAPEFRENNYKCMLRVYNNAETGREGRQKLMWAMCPGGAPGYGACGCGASFFEEPFGGDGTWDGSPQRLRIEWGGGATRYLRNGAVVLTINWSSSGLTFGPSELHLSLGTSRPSAVDSAQLPVGAVFSDLVVDGTEGALAVCPGATTPDAGPPPMDASPPVMPGNVLDLLAVEDVTVDPSLATTVYPDANDLAVGAGDSEFYVKFRVGALPGRVVRAQLILHSAMHASAEGTGASVFAAASSAWSESTLAWSARPGPRGTRLARIEGITVNETYALDLPVDAVTAAGTYAFAVLPEAGDSNSAHFDSKEVSASRGPLLRLTIDRSTPPVDASVAPDVTSPLDVSATPDVTSPPDGTAMTDGSAVTDVARVADASAQVDVEAPRDVTADEANVDYVPAGGCSCRTPATRSEGAPYALALASLALRRRRRGR